LPSPLWSLRIVLGNLYPIPIIWIVGSTTLQFCANRFTKKCECLSKRKKSHIIQAHKKITICLQTQKTPFDYTTLFNGEFGGANSDAKGANSDVKGSMCKHAWLK
jgi:hypothetical protein